MLMCQVLNRRFGNIKVAVCDLHRSNTCHDNTDADTDADADADAEDGVVEDHDVVDAAQNDVHQGRDDPSMLDKLRARRGDCSRVCNYQD